MWHFSMFCLYICVCVFALQIEDLRYKTKLFSLNLDGNPICDKLPDNIDFRLYIAAYLPKLKYYGYRLITNTERDEGYKIYKYVQIQLNIFHNLVYTHVQHIQSVYKCVHKHGLLHVRWWFLHSQLEFHSYCMHPSSFFSGFFLFHFWIFWNVRIDLSQQWEHLLWFHLQHKKE